MLGSYGDNGKKIETTIVACLAFRVCNFEG